MGNEGKFLYCSCSWVHTHHSSSRVPPFLTPPVGARHLPQVPASLLPASLPPPCLPPGPLPFPLQARAISLKSLPMSLVMQGGSGKSYVLNLMDTPGELTTMC